VGKPIYVKEFDLKIIGYYFESTETHAIRRMKKRGIFLSEIDKGFKTGIYLPDSSGISDDRYNVIFKINNTYWNVVFAYEDHTAQIITVMEARQDEIAIYKHEKSKQNYK